MTSRWASPALAAACALAAAPVRAVDGADDLDPALAVEDIRPQAIFDEHLYEGVFKAPGAVACDRERGEIYVADTGNHRIGIFTASGMPLFAFADAEHLREPRRVAVMKDGRILVVDNDRERVKVFGYRGQFLRFLEPPGQGGERPNVAAVAVDADGNVYVGENTAGQVVVFDPDLRYRFRFGSRGEEAGQFRSIGGIAVAGKLIAVIDQQGVAVHLFDRAGNFLRGFGAHEMGAENFSLPAGVAIDAKGRIVVVDALRHEIKLFLQDGKFVGRFGGMGSGPGNVAFPSDVAVDGEGRLVVAESVGNRVQVLRAVPVGEDPAPAAWPSKGGGRDRRRSTGFIGAR